MLHDGQERIDNRVARDDRTSRQRLACDVLLGARRRHEHQIADDIDHAAVHLLGPRACHVAGAQAGFDMRDRHAPMKCGERASGGRSGVAVHEDSARLLFFDDFIQSRDQFGRQTVQALVLRHHAQIVLGRDIEKIQNLLEHRAMLAGHTQRNERLAPPPTPSRAVPS